MLMLHRLGESATEVRVVEPGAGSREPGPGVRVSCCGPFHSLLSLRGSASRDFSLQLEPVMKPHHADPTVSTSARILVLQVLPPVRQSLHSPPPPWAQSGPLQSISAL
jgi:hypothetical protein